MLGATHLMSVIQMNEKKDVLMHDDLEVYSRNKDGTFTDRKMFIQPAKPTDENSAAFFGLAMVIGAGLAWAVERLFSNDHTG